MRIIDIPAPVTVPLSAINAIGPQGSEKVEFIEWLKHSLNNYAPLGKGYENIMKASSISKVLKSVEPGQKTITLENEDYEELKKAVNDMPWKTGYAIEVVSFYEAFWNAQKVTTPQKK